MAAYGAPPEEPPRLAWGMWKRFLAGMAAIVFLTATSTATAVLLQVDSAVKDFLTDNEAIPGIDEVLDDVDAGDPQTILVIGSDRRWGDKSAGIEPRSDTIILLRLDPDQGATTILSIPRDLKVTYQGENGSYEDKINAAYSIGGPKATVRKIKGLMPGSFPIHHVVNVNFGGFQRGVNRLGCVYIDVDRRYFNDNNPPRFSDYNYATIDLQPGYQRLCGQDSLDFVRYRHLDTDIVRAARQQSYLSQAKQQIGFDRLFGDREELLRILGRYTDTDIRSTTATLRLLKLVYEASRHPLREVRFPGEVGETYVTISEDRLDRVREQFFNGGTRPRASGGGAQGQRRPQRRRQGQGIPGLVSNPRPAEDLAIVMATKLRRLPVYFPRQMRRGSTYSENSRAYDLYAPGSKRHDAYRIVAEAPGIGEFYGIQGTTWKDPPILKNASETRRIGGRKYELFYDGNRLRHVAWRTQNGSYWVSNTLMRSLTTRQMLGIARSLTRVGASG